jgi:glyoxylase-like metal-dependent hydrolase (beta-lactamase superfamily II)
VTLLIETFTELGVTRLSRWIFNCYLIHDGGNEAPVAVDAGLPGVDNDLLQVMAEVGLDPTTLAAVVATHAHSDHVGGAPSLSLRSGAPVYLPQPVDGYLHGVKPRSPARPRSRGSGRRSWTNPSTRATRSEAPESPATGPPPVCDGQKSTGLASSLPTAPFRGHPTGM